MPVWWPCARALLINFTLIPMTPTLRIHEDGPKVDVQRFRALVHGPERAHERCTSRSTVYYDVVHVLGTGPLGGFSMRFGGVFYEYSILMYSDVF